MSLQQTVHASASRDQAVPGEHVVKAIGVHPEIDGGSPGITGMAAEGLEDQPPLPVAEG